MRLLASRTHAVELKLVSTHSVPRYGRRPLVEKRRIVNGGHYHVIHPAAFDAVNVIVREGLMVEVIRAIVNPDAQRHSLI